MPDPLPPEVLADALQDRIHPTSGRLLATTPMLAPIVKIRIPPDGTKFPSGVGIHDAFELVNLVRWLCEGITEQHARAVVGRLAGTNASRSCLKLALSRALTDEGVGFEVADP